MVRHARIVGYIAAFMTAAAVAQSPPPKFDVVSIKPGDQWAFNPTFHPSPGGRYWVENGTTLAVILMAFGTDGQRIANVPDWVRHERFTIDAKPPTNPPPISGQGEAQHRLGARGPQAGASISGMPAAGGLGPAPINARQQQEEMLQAMLADRFGLKTHRETRRMAVYELVVAKGGSKFPPSPPPGQRPAIVGPVDPKHPNEFMSPGPGEVAAGISGMQNLPGFLARQLGRPVVDKTGITGNYEIRLNWQPEPGEAAAARAGTPPPGANSPSIYTALEEQLGLRLRAATDAVEILVIDHIARPTPD